MAETTKQRLHAEIAAYAEANAGTEVDLDEALEQAGLETLQANEELDFSPAVPRSKPRPGILRV
ncbi:MAG TPA: hypothetical protein VLT87_10410 [Thermoanaerobaculia bacterium]|nr:hypothetical protein [Thermoanaerobaculia bacterium]